MSFCIVLHDAIAARHHSVESELIFMLTVSYQDYMLGSATTCLYYELTCHLVKTMFLDSYFIGERHICVFIFVLVTCGLSKYDYWIFFLLSSIFL